MINLINSVKLVSIFIILEFYSDLQVLSAFRDSLLVSIFIILEFYSDGKAYERGVKGGMFQSLLF